MSLLPLLPIAGAALGPIARNAIDRIADGLSFLDVLHADEPEAKEEVPTQPASADFDIAGLVSQLHERFAMLGIDVNTPIRLKQDGRGGVVVDGDHPDRVLVETLFASDQELTSAFNALATSVAGDDEYASEDVRLTVDNAGAQVGFI